MFFHVVERPKYFNDTLGICNNLLNNLSFLFIPKAHKKAKILFSLGFHTPAAFTTSKHGSRALLINGHKYVKDRKTQETINWRCAFFIRFKCKARAITRVVNGIERVKETNGIHTHEMHKFTNDSLDKIYDG